MPWMNSIMLHMHQWLQQSKTTITQVNFNASWIEFYDLSDSQWMKQQSRPNLLTETLSWFSLFTLQLLLFGKNPSLHSFPFSLLYPSIPSLPFPSFPSPHSGHALLVLCLHNSWMVSRPPLRSRGRVVYNTIEAQKAYTFQWG